MRGEAGEGKGRRRAERETKEARRKERVIRKI